MRISELMIDPDFRDCLPKLTEQEYEQLEKNILSDGIREPLVIWNKYLIDGHNRYRICFSNGIADVPVVEKQFADKLEAITWIYSNEAGRRHSLPVDRLERTEKVRAELKRKGLENKASGGRSYSPKEVLANSPKLTPSEKVNTRAERAKIANVKEHDVRSYDALKKFASSDKQEEAEVASELLQEAKSGAVSLGVAAKRLKERLAPEGYKFCPKCQEIKPFDAFCPNNAKPNGRASWCKDCFNKFRREQTALKAVQAKEAEKEEPQKDDMSIRQIKKMLKDESAVPVVTENHIMEMVNANIDNFINSISSVISMNESSFDSCKEKVKATIIARISEFCEERI